MDVHRIYVFLTWGPALLLCYGPTRYLNPGLATTCNQAESCKGSSAMEIRAARASAKLRQLNRTDKGIELTMQLLHSC